MNQRQLFHQPPSVSALRGHITDELAYVRGMDVGDLKAEVGEPLADAEVDSKEAEVVISRLHVRLGFDLRAVKVEDLEPEKLATIGALATLIHGAIAA